MSDCNENSNECNLEHYKPIGIIGSGNMGTGIIKGLISSKLVNPEDIIATNSRHKDLIKLKSQGVIVENSNEIVAEKSKTIILAVKPKLIQDVISEISSFIIGKLLISVASGISIETIQKSMPGKLSPVIRVMPNTAVEVHEGCAAITPSLGVSSSDINACKLIFQSICKVCEVVSEDNIDSMIGISGSGIAYIYVVAEALIDAGVKMGLARDVSNKLVAQTLVGAGKMILETGQHPMQLKDHVTSPGGCTICGVAKLEELGLRNALIQAAEAAKEKAQKH